VPDVSVVHHSRPVVPRIGNIHAKPRGTDKSGISTAQWKRVEKAWSYSWPDTKVCDFAGITTGKLNVAYKNNPELKEKRDLLKKTTFFNSHKNIHDSIKSQDISTTKWYLERKDPEFSTKTQVNVEVNHTVKESEVLKRLSSYLNTQQLQDNHPTTLEAEYREVLPNSNTLPIESTSTPESNNL